LRKINSVARIRFEHTRYPHWGARSGYTNFIRHLDHQHFQTLLHGASDSDKDLAWLWPIWPPLKLIIRRGRMPWYKLSDLNAELRALASCLAGKIDIIHFLDGEHSPWLLPKAVRFARLSKIRTIVTFHQPPMIARELINLDVLRWVDHVVLVSPSQVPFFLKYVPEDRLHVILHGIDTEFFHPPASRRDTSGFRCITVGHHLREWSVLREIAAALPEVRFDVVTGFETGLDGLANVQIHRDIADGTLAELYRSVDILLLPLSDSTANNTLLEGMASGLPVVATDLPAIRAYAPDDGAILVSNNSLDGFVTSLQSLLQDRSLRHAMGRSARARAEELAWPRLVPEYEALYRRMLARGPLGHSREERTE
jgi:glycosyltransferase involved in cell wall biosynthesis